MSAFCVHGVSKARCLEVARKKVGLNILDGRGKVVGTRTEAQREAAVAEEAERLYATSKPAAISPRYDAPTFAERFLSACKGEAFRDLCIYALVPRRDGFGRHETDPKTKRPLYDWKPWNNGAAAKAA